MAKKQWQQTEDELLDELEAKRFKERLAGPEQTDWHEAFHSPYKVVCNCDWPHVARSGSQSLGIVVDIDVCCLAKAVEELTGKRFYRVTWTDPVFTWDENAIVGTYCDLCRGNIPQGRTVMEHFKGQHQVEIRQGSSHLDAITDDQGQKDMADFLAEHTKPIRLGPPAPFHQKRLLGRGLPIVRASENGGAAQ